MTNPAFDDLRRACPEFFDFVVALARWDTVHPEDHRLAIEKDIAARALLAAIEAGKVEPPHQSGCHCYACKYERANSDPPKPEPPKQRSAEEIIEQMRDWLMDSEHERGPYPGSNSLTVALCLVRELREERDENHRAMVQARIERDELQRRIEAALRRLPRLAEGDSGIGYHKSVDEGLLLRRILSGAE